jgi:anti-sigma regulatory factor (Ser/Thr protein kinase)
MSQAGFHHTVLFYDDADEFLAGTVPYLRDALEADEPALVAVGRERAESLRAELGEEAGGVRFAPMEELGRNPARIIPFWRDFLDEYGGRDRPVCGIGEPVWPGRGEAELDECRRHERLLNLAFAGAPAWSLLCPYDNRSLEDEVLEAADRCHPFLIQGGLSEQNATGTEAEPVSADPFAGTLPARPPDVEGFEFDRHALREVRALVATAAERANLSSSRTSDLVTAAGELAANSILHGGGRGAIGVWREAGELVVEVEDAGTIEEPLVGRLRPPPTQDGGRGVWIANVLCDLVQIRSNSEGTAVRIRIGLG